ncbi:hypothetical protein [Chitinasiproducens palmae]|uniref:Uncharacterized protein n=1 Tax=Chitinasiproducens palmae TaxID=1770053 RepID=A0A1H2PQV8_9BURK|nr:hypothetical protein [Chitinasiproducens palmae]SDV49200.1 hypothetical protein SAMN05216551_107148 [Chitinasiproducens palmae]
MKFLGLSPSVPTVQTVDTTPAVTDTTKATDDAADRAKRRRGVAATVLAGDNAAPTANSVATKTLLGS